MTTATECLAWMEAHADALTEAEVAKLVALCAKRQASQCAAKRPRQCANTLLDLPADVLHHVLECLTFRDLVHCRAAARGFAHPVGALDLAAKRAAQFPASHKFLPHLRCDAPTPRQLVDFARLEAKADFAKLAAKTARWEANKQGESNPFFSLNSEGHDESNDNSEWTLVVLHGRRPIFATRFDLYCWAHSYFVGVRPDNEDFMATREECRDWSRLRLLVLVGTRCAFDGKPIQSTGDDVRFDRIPTKGLADGIDISYRKRQCCFEFEAA